MASKFKSIKSMICSVAVGVMIASLHSCYVFDFFTRKRGGNSSEGGDGLEVLGDDLGAKAGGRNEEALAAVYAINAAYAPAGVRKDPDVLVRRLLRQFRSEGTTLARVVGEVENYRILLGGASDDFSTAPANGYDATSVLATMKVAEEVCLSLVAPNATQHTGWQTILPNPATDVRTNLLFLVQRITGIKSSEISDTKIDQLDQIFDSANTDNNITYSDYVAPCTAVVLDAQAMLM